MATTSKMQSAAQAVLAKLGASDKAEWMARNDTWRRETVRGVVQAARAGTTGFCRCGHCDAECDAVAAAVTALVSP